MDTLKLHSHFENLLYVGRSVLTNTSSRIQRLFFKKEMCIRDRITTLLADFFLISIVSNGSKLLI